MLLLGMARAFIREGHELRIAYFSEGPLRADFEALGVPLHRLSRRGLKDVRVLPRLVGLLRAFRPDVLHTHLFKSDCCGQVAGWLAGVPVRVSTIHNVDPWRKNPLYGTAIRAITAPCQRHIAVSEEVCAYTRRWSHYPAGRMTVIPNGVDLAAFDPAAVAPLDREEAWGVPRLASTIGIVGRLQPAKGHHLLLQAAVELIRTLPDVRIIVVGDGPLRDELVSACQRLGLGEHVVFAGFRRDMARVLATLDVVVFASRWEGLPISLLEALAMERPVVSTAVGGIPDAVRHEHDALLVPPGNAAALAEGLRCVLHDPSLAVRLGRAGRETVRRRYSAAHMHARIMALYRELGEKEA